MGNLFSADEMLGMGIQIERNGASFYTVLMQKAERKEAKKLFAFLAGEEEKHIKVFEKLQTQVQPYEPAESYPGEFSEYLRKAASEHVFVQSNAGIKAAEKAVDEKTALDMGIEFEKDSIVFYSQMRDMVVAHAQKTINDLIEQEKEHLELLASLKGRTS